MECLSKCMEVCSSHKKCFPGVYISIEKKARYIMLRETGRKPVVFQFTFNNKTVLAWLKAFMV